MKNIVLNIPHSSINGIYDEKYGKWCRSPLFINNIVYKWTDWYTDYLFSVDNSCICVYWRYFIYICSVLVVIIYIVMFNNGTAVSYCFS